MSATEQERRNHVAALLSARTTGGDEIWIAEHWAVHNAQPWRLSVFYDDTRPFESLRAPTVS